MTEDEEDRWLAEHWRLGQIVIDQIHDAFADVEQGTVANLEDIVEDTTWDRMSSRPEGGMNTRWQDIPDADIAGHNDLFPFMDERAFRYYVPAYMCWACRELGEFDSTSADYLLYNLELSSEPGTRAWQLEKWSLFNQAQRCSICMFLRFMYGFYSNKDAEKALESYWGQFCDSPA